MKFKPQGTRSKRGRVRIPIYKKEGLRLLPEVERYIYGQPLKPKDLNPDRVMLLWRSVILQAWQDAHIDLEEAWRRLRGKEEGQTKFENLRRIKRSALQWFFSDREDLSNSFLFLCQVLKLQPNKIRNQLQNTETKLAA